MKKKLTRLSGILFALFVLLNISWFAWRSVKYAPYGEGMEYNNLSFMVPRYKMTDEDGYDYSIKYPDYLTSTGNLCVGIPASDENMFTDALIIWPLVTGGYEYGILLHDEDNSYQIYVDENGNALDDSCDVIIEQHRSNIDSLLDKASAVWNIG